MKSNKSKLNNQIIKQIIKHEKEFEASIFEPNSYYLYERRRKQPWISVKYIKIITSKKTKNKKKHLFIEVESGQKFCISCNAVRARNFQKLYK